ncbi:hypothetical protein KEM54_001151 [Ascosphaera aggregata]|nr:hypothetical protein KEM54_001151 [Ascosphaera aggregata]
MTNPRTVTGTLKTIAQTAFANSSQYERYRPTFGHKPVQALLEGLKIAGSQGAKVIDLGAGTGKFTEVLARRDEGYEIIAVEPHDAMRKELEKKNLDNVSAVEGFSTDMPVESQSIDAVIASQVKNLIRYPFADEDTLAEAHRVLRPGHCLGLIWNIEDYNAPQEWTPTTPYESKLKEIIWSLHDNENRFRHGKWRAVFDRQGQKSPAASGNSRRLFQYPIEEDAIPFTTHLQKDDVWNRMRTLSHIANSDKEEQEV